MENMRTRQVIPGVVEALCPCQTSYARQMARDYDTIWAWRYIRKNADNTVVFVPTDKCPKCEAELYDDGTTSDAAKCYCKEPTDFCSFCDDMAQWANDMRPD